MMSDVNAYLKKPLSRSFSASSIAVAEVKGSMGVLCLCYVSPCGRVDAYVCSILYLLVCIKNHTIKADKSAPTAVPGYIRWLGSPA